MNTYANKYVLSLKKIKMKKRQVKIYRNPYLIGKEMDLNHAGRWISFLPNRYYFKESRDFESLTMDFNNRLIIKVFS